jgi:hypothetical protein
MVNPDPETVALIISKVEPADEGKYEVILTNDLGEAKTEGELITLRSAQGLLRAQSIIFELLWVFLLTKILPKLYNLTAKAIWSGRAKQGWFGGSKCKLSQKEFCGLGLLRT